MRPLLIILFAFSVVAEVPSHVPGNVPGNEPGNVIVPETSPENSYGRTPEKTPENSYGKSPETSIVSPEHSPTPPSTPLGELRSEESIDTEIAKSFGNEVREVGKNIEANASFDLQYATNGPVQQGYSVPRLSVGMSASLSDHTRVQVKTGQTRELTSVQLPFLIPKEVSLEFVHLADTEFSIKAGLFRPWLNRYWSEQSNVFPEYFGMHQALLQNEQVGVEGQFVMIQDIECGLGMTNGNGLFALNSNNARSFHAFFRSRESKSEITKIMWSLSGFWFRQSSPGGANFKDNWVANALVGLDLGSMGIKTGIEWIWAGYKDNDTSYYPRATAFHLILPFIGGSELMVRAEELKSSPILGGKTYKQFQIGPMFKINSSVTLYLIESYVEPGVTSGEVSTYLKLRVEL